MAKKDNSQFDKANQEKPKLQPLISVKTFKSLQDIKNGDSFEEALRKLYLLMWENISTDREQQEIDGLFEEEAELNKARQHQQILEALFSLKEDKISRQQKRQEERKETKKAEKPKKVEAPKTAEKVQKPSTPPKQEVPKQTTEAVKKEVAPAPKPSAESIVPKPSGAIPKSTAIAKIVAGGAGVIGTITAGLVSAGITNEYAQKAVIGNVGKETGFKPKEENLAAYGKTSNERIRQVFTKRVEKYSDAELNEIKKDPVRFGEAVYGKDTSIGQKMGNNEPGDGFKYRGRGAIQLTGKNNYKAYSKAAGVDLVNNPDVLNDPAIDVKVVADFVKTGVGEKINDFTNQGAANRAVTQVIGGKSLNLDSGIGAELLSKVDQYADVLPSVGSGQQLASASTENKDLKKPSAGGVTVINNTNNNIVKGGNQETLITNKPNDKPQLLQ
jgi:predicted chitinase